MPDMDHLVAVDYVDPTPPELSISVAGTCPGDVTIHISSADPLTNVIVFAGLAEGTFALPRGPCAGTELGILQARKWQMIRTDAGGEASISGSLPLAWCTRYLQGMDPSCSTSNVAGFP